MREPTDDRPEAPKKVVEKRIDPPRYQTKKECVAYYTTGTKKGQCQTYNTKKKEIDDRDWVLITNDGVAYDVEESEYNSVKVGDLWPHI